MTKCQNKLHELLSSAVSSHQAGQLEKAELQYRQILALDPQHIDCLHNLGLIAHQRGKHAVAVALISNAIALNDRIPNFYNTLGIAEHAVGNLDSAIGQYRKALSLNPNYAEAHNNLANGLKDQGRLDEAIQHYQRALILKPDFADAHNNLANVLKRQGKFDEAAVGYRRALALKPNYPQALYNLANVFRAQGQLEAAIAQYEYALARYPDHAEAHNNLGNALAEQERWDEALEHFQQAIAVKPNYADAHNNLGTVLKKKGKLSEAVVHYERALALNPDYADAHNNMGSVLNEQGKLQEAVNRFERALALQPDKVEAHNNLGNALVKQGDLAKAVKHYEQSLALKPNVPEVHYNLGVALQRQGQIAQAVSHYRRALVLKPDSVDGQNNLGTVLKDQGKLEEALTQFRSILDHQPNNALVHSNLLFCLMYDEKLSSDELFRAHREWDARHGQSPRPASYPNDRTAGRRLKIGYVSGDFCVHPVASFLAPLLNQHDRKHVEVFCYAEVQSPDRITENFQAVADHWHVTVGESDDAVASRIASDEIDILVDVAGHTARNRLPVFARKPAPVQITWLGYPNSTGLSAIDFRLVDRLTDPSGQDDLDASERLFRLDAPFLCYDPPDDGPEPTRPPVFETGTITFGSFNNPTKISAATVEAWAELLRRMPRARLLLKGLPFDDEQTRGFYEARFRDRGVPPERLALSGRTSSRETHLARYGEIDIALDPFPYNGTTTTCEALWMGVPVVTLRGKRHCGRVGASLMASIDHPEWIAANAKDYVDIAINLAADRSRLTGLRSSLRSEMKASPLCDAPRFARKVEAAYRWMWQEWCASSCK